MTMKLRLSVASVALMLAAAPAISSAACDAPATRVATLADLTALLKDNTACVGLAHPFESQELHQAGGALIDYKCGPGKQIDPTKQVGNWSIIGSNARGFFVSYNYGQGKIYTYSVWNNGDGTHSFCSANPEVRVRMISGSGPCAPVPPTCR